MGYIIEKIIQFIENKLTSEEMNINDLILYYDFLCQISVGDLRELLERNTQELLRICF